MPFDFGRRCAAAALSCALFSGLLFAPKEAQALTFNFTAPSNIDPNALAGFTSAGNLWSSYFTDNVTVNISVGFSSLGSSILAQTSSTQSFFSYDAVHTALSADVTSVLDATAVANLQAGPALQFVTNNSSGAVVLDKDSLPTDQNANNNRFLVLTSANAKALGLTTTGTSDASITFSSDFTYDFDRSNGINGGTFDFVGLAAHEIGHALGFVSGVDTVDYYSGPTTGLNSAGQRVTAQDLNGSAVFNTLDLFRYSSASITQVAGFGKVMDLTQGTIGAQDVPKFFSVDGGATNMGAFSTGPYDGDGRQASHWKDNQGLGIMDPTAAPGELLQITGNDLNAFDAIGWNLASAQAPEPSDLSLIGGAFVMFGGIRIARRRKRTA